VDFSGLNEDRFYEIIHTYDVNDNNMYCCDECYCEIEENKQHIKINPTFERDSKHTRSGQYFSFTCIVCYDSSCGKQTYYHHEFGIAYYDYWKCYKGDKKKNEDEPFGKVCEDCYAEINSK